MNMTRSELHKRKRKKNYILLAILVAWIALIWAITIIKMAS
jgi:hypothetical protein